MKFLLTLFIPFFLTPTKYSDSQTIESVAYNKKYMYLSFVEERNGVYHEKHRLPFGKDVTISYDDFYERYSISYTYKDGSLILSHFDYLYSSEEGVPVYEDKHGNKWFALDGLSTGNDLTLVGLEIMKKGNIELHSSLHFTNYHFTIKE